MVNKKTDTGKVDKKKKTASADKPATKKVAQSSKLKKPASPKADDALSVMPTPVPTIKSSPIKPNQEDAMRLVTQTMNNFITSKQEKTMEKFFHTVSKVWQEMTTVEKLNSAFSVVIADEADWSFLKTIQPSLLKDGLSERGDWVVVGVYPTKPKKLIFDQIFVNEDNEWKLAELKLFTSD